MASRPAVFVDRDGTLNRDCPYCRRPEDIVLLPTVAEGVRLLNDAGLPVVLITNQSGVARGYFTEEDLGRIHGRLQGLLGAAGARLDAVYHCPHLPEAGCACRKPGTELVERAARDLRLDPARSAVIGDRGLDMELAQRVGSLAVMVPGDLGRRELQDLDPPPDHVAPDFRAAARWVAGRLDRP